MSGLIPPCFSTSTCGRSALVFFMGSGWLGAHEVAREVDELVRRWLLLLTLFRNFSFARKTRIASGSSSGAPLFFQRRIVERATPWSDAYSDVEERYFVTPEAGCQSAHEVARTRYFENPTLTNSALRRTRYRPAS